MSRRVLMVGSALLLAVLGAVAVLMYVSRADDRALAGKQAVTVLVAAKKVTAGTTAKDAESEGLFRTEEMPAETVPADVVGSVDTDLASLVANADIQAGQLVLRPMFVAKQQQTGGLAIPDGKLAVSIRVAAAPRVAGYVQAGSKVAVFDTFNMLEGAGRTPAGDGLQTRQHGYNQATRLLLTNVEVIALGGQASSGDGDKDENGLAGSSTAAGDDTVLVTVAVSQADAEKLIHATQLGAVYLALLTDSSQTSPSQGVDNGSVFAD